MDVSMEERNTSLSQNGAQLQLPPPVPSSSTQTYRYLPLKHDHDIRLLYLLPGKDRAPLSCSLRIVSLSEPPVYEALSYTWGEPIFSASIECFPKGHLPITENLSKALFHLRLADRLRVLWIDAICINQQDLVERSHQVTLLRDTFQRAKNVIVWLGEDTGDASRAFGILRAIDPSSSNVNISKLIDEDGHNALANLLGRSWFRRIWVVQELICAQKAIITCGNHEMEWERFLDVARTIRETGVFGSIRDQSVQDALLILGGIRLRRRSQEQQEIEILLYYYRSCVASDPRDKVFALVGIAGGQTAPAYTPDYSKSVLEVYRNLAMHLIIAEQNPDVLVHCAYIVGSKSPLLPSWVPDWSQNLYSNCSPLLCPGAYEASAGTSFRGRVSGNLDELFLDGVLVNKVEVIGGVWYFGDLNDQPNILKRLIEFHEECIDMFRSSPRYRACYWSAFTRALVADKDHCGKRLGQRDLSEVYVTYRQLISWHLLATRLSFPLRFLKGSRLSVESTESRDFERTLELAAYGRVFCMFDDGRAGWVPKAAEVGDQIAIFLGATVPILLRPRGNGYIVLGEAYVDEMMDGQAFEGPDVQIETITLV